KTILFNLSGHGLIDMQAYDEYFAGDLSNYPMTDELLNKSIAPLEKVI
ncbi:MAG: TrpB-like pyridoxal-phosphate dependent enzyme, partial [Tannerella sp.]|nr:TrpB-like pyridoxal-phosphate dependent enzyme [Tannerella sp.]